MILNDYMMKKWLFQTLIMVVPIGMHAQKLPEILPVLTGFDQAIENHSAKKALKYMDADYLLNQHDQMLDGNTAQFLDELLSGYSSPGEGTFVNVHLKNVLQMDVYELIPLDDSHQVTWKLLLEDGRVLYTTMWVKLNRKTGQFGIVGPVG